MIERTRYLKMIRPYYHSEQIKALVGVRRAGKSTLMRQIIGEISETVDPSRILYIDFEDFEYEMYCDNPHLFYEKVKDFCFGKERCFVFLDEIQHMQKFELVISSIRSTLGASVFVTGSTSSLFSGALSEKLTGRMIEFRIFPFSYVEASRITGKEDEELFFSYMRKGGMPLRFNESYSSGFSHDLYKSIVRRDILSSHSIQNPHLFQNFASYVLSASGEVLSVNNMVSQLRSDNESISLPSAYAYLDYLESAFLVTSCSRYDIKGKQILTTKKKYYASDTSFIYAQKGNRNINEGTVLETIVFTELLSRGYEVYTGKTFKGEIDFVVLDGEGKCYLQVCHTLMDEAIIEREFGAFSSIRDNYPKYVLSLDSLDFSRDGIIHMNIRDFLSERRSLMFL